MPPDGDGKAIGRLEGEMKGLHNTVSRVEGKIDCIDRKVGVLPQLDTRVSVLERTKRTWTRFFVIVGGGLSIVGITAFITYLMNNKP